MSEKFDNIITEAAYEITLHGFAEETYGTVDTTGWNALVTVSATTLLNVGAPTDMVERFRAEVPGIAGTLAWIRENNEGFVTLVDHGGDGDRSGGTEDSVNRAWDEYVVDMDRQAEEAEEESADWTYGDPKFGAVNERETGWTGR